MRPVAGSTEAEYQSTLVKTQQEIAAASKIVIVGGGSVGLEVAGEIRAAHPSKSITIVHSLAHVLHATKKTPDYSKTGPSSYSSPPTVMKLSVELEKNLKALKIDLVLDDKVVIPNGEVAAGEWNGHFGALGGVKTVKTRGGKSLEADYVFISVGNKPEAGLVEKADKGAINAGMVGVDDYLRVSHVA
jgi:pyruvate/2-oxoglutarate dehydrogenase complex dihydrolipoamide dehydrogenase (E3) component